MEIEILRLRFATSGISVSYTAKTVKITLFLMILNGGVLRGIVSKYIQVLHNRKDMFAVCKTQFC